jgi:hypothetical protein
MVEILRLDVVGCDYNDRNRRNDTRIRYVVGIVSLRAACRQKSKNRKSRDSRENELKRAARNAPLSAQKLCRDSHHLGAPQHQFR